MAGSYFLSGPLPLPGSGNTIKFTQFTSNDTWTKDANAQWVTCVIWNGGAGGGSGRKGASTAAGGGGGGAAGNVMIYSASANLFGATESITIGAGGAGGAAVAADNTDGNDGSTVGTQSLVGNMGPSLLSFNATTLGGGGGVTTTSASTAFGGIYTNGLYGVGNQQVNFTNSSIAPLFSIGRGRNVAGDSPTNIGDYIGSTISSYWSYNYAPGYGGGGGGADTVTERSGGTGSSILFGDQTTMLAGGTAGLESTGINGGNGSDFILPVSGAIFGGSGGGGGGGYSVGAMGATAGGNGGNGGIPGGGGGGGGGGLNAVADSGAGGAGGRGEVWIYEILG